MTDETANLILELLRRLDVKVDRLTDAVGDLQRRVSSIELSVAQLHGDFAGQSVRIDKIEARLLRIERRLEIVPA